MSELRRIRTLRLRAPRREQVARAAIALEDAWRTASLPLLPRGALLLVRRLDLGRLPADASPQWLSRRIEMRLRDLRPAPVRHDEPAAAPAVWFADRSEALAALLATSLRSVPRAWYWAGVLPGWRPGMAMRELLPLALRQAADEPHAAAGTAGAAALLDRLLHADQLDAVLEHLEPGHLPAAAATAMTLRSQPISGASPGTEPGGMADAATIPSQRHATEPAMPAMTSDAWRAALVRWTRRWGPADRRARWLAAHALVAMHGPAAAAHAERLIARLAAPPGVPTLQPGRAPPNAGAAAPDLDLPPTGSGVEAERSPPESAGDVARLTAQSAPDGAPLAALPSAAPRWEPTRHGGLLLLVQALARLEIDRADADGDLCLRLLHRIADRLKIRRDDAIRRTLPEPLPRRASRSFVPPAAWQGLMRLPRGADLGREDCLLAVCQLALARFLRRYARISPRRLVRRPALVHATRTHIDICFDARWVELEVRLAGLDLDPGWVPWLGRVVSFHYDYEGQP